MPELPDIIVYIEALKERILNQTLERVTIASPFLLRTATPPISDVEGRRVVELRRLGKRICIGLEGDLWLVLHLMIAGRLHWKQVLVSTARGSGRVPTRAPKNQLATFHFLPNGILSLTEAGTQRRASLQLVTTDDLKRLDPGGLEIFDTDLKNFARVLQSENHTLKRALTDPRLFSGIGNAYSDEILWEAQLSPVALTQKLDAEEIEHLFNSTRATLTKWIAILRADKTPSSKVQRPKSKAQSPKTQTQSSKHKAQSSSFPEKVTAFRPEMAVHGKYHEPCPRCGNKVQRIRYASNETNYCPHCQTKGKLLTDRALSRLLRADWPRTADELEGLTRQ